MAKLMRMPMGQACLGACRRDGMSNPADCVAFSRLLAGLALRAALLARLDFGFPISTLFGAESFHRATRGEHVILRIQGKILPQDGLSRRAETVGVQNGVKEQMLGAKLTFAGFGAPLPSCRPVRHTIPHAFPSATVRLHIRTRL